MGKKCVKPRQYILFHTSLLEFRHHVLPDSSRAVDVGGRAGLAGQVDGPPAAQPQVAGRIVMTIGALPPLGGYRMRGEVIGQR